MTTRKQNTTQKLIAAAALAALLALFPATASAADQFSAAGARTDLLGGGEEVDPLPAPVDPVSWLETIGERISQRFARFVGRGFHIGRGSNDDLNRPAPPPDPPMGEQATGCQNTDSGGSAMNFGRAN